MSPRETKTAILQAAIALLGRAGADGFSASALAAETGVSKATLFHHFKSMDDIPIEALDLLSDQALAFDLPADAGLAEFLEEIGEISFNILEARRGFLQAYFTFVSKAMFDPRLKAKMQISLNGAKAQVQELLSIYVPDPTRARDLTNMVMILLDGGMMHILLLQNEAEVRAMWDRFSTILIAEFSNENRD